MKMQLALLGILGCLCAVGANANPSVSSAISLISREVPDASAVAESSNEWRTRLARVINALRSQPEFDRQLKLDAAKAAAKAAASPLAVPTFGCSLPKSPAVPTSVHQLRPGDVKVVGAMGDSLTAANGAKATSVLGLLIEYRGFSWSIGGQTDLSDHTTLANILRSGNPSLTGHSTGNGNSNSITSGMNVAEPGKKARDLPGQAARLVDKMRADPNIDFQNDWKVITVFVGGNDVCDYCQDKNLYSASNYVKNIRDALDYLHANVPRAFVNVAEVLDVALVRELKDTSFTCGTLLGGMLCKCAASPTSDAEFNEIKQLIADYQKNLRSLVDSGRYDTRADFTVVNQPFYRNSAPPRVNGKYDTTFLAPDCFHFSHKGHAEAAKALWNNMLEAVGSKSTSWTPNGGFKCPTTKQPYFRTSKN